MEVHVAHIGRHLLQHKQLFTNESSSPSLMQCRRRKFEFLLNSATAGLLHDDIIAKDTLHTRLFAFEHNLITDLLSSLIYSLTILNILEPV